MLTVINKPRKTAVQPITYEQMLAAMPIARKHYGFGKLLSVDDDPKTAKSNKGGVYLTAIVYLWPGLLCQWATTSCLQVCLNTAGEKCRWPLKKKARVARKELLVKQPAVFAAKIFLELTSFVARCKRLGVKPAVRLNGTSDVPWERIMPWLFKLFPQVKFYDYTKGYERLGKTPRNYWLTLSRSEANSFEVGAALARGHHVAVIMQDAKKQQPNTWGGYKTDDGDQDDLIFTRKGQVQLLSPKGKARKDTSGFVVANGF